MDENEYLQKAKGLIQCGAVEAALDAKNENLLSCHAPADGCYSARSIP